MYTRREFLAGVAAAGAGLGPALTVSLQGRAGAADLAAGQAMRAANAEHITILHTADIHAQLEPHDEVFFEDAQRTFKRRGGFATLKTMIESLRRQNPDRTLVVDGGDCLQGGAVAALSKGRAIVPLINAIGYDLMLPGNWEVVYGKGMMVDNMRAYRAAKVCANMFHADRQNARSIFPPYHVFRLGTTRVGFVGYNDPLTATRQSPAFSRGIRYTHPEADLASYVRILRDEKECHVVFVLSHMGLAQQLFLAAQPYASGVDYILGGDTHERVREPLHGRFSTVTEPGAFASFVSKLDLVVEKGVIKEAAYALLDVDPDRYPEDERMKTLVAVARAPYRAEIDRVIGRTRTPLMRNYVIETPMDNLITDALMWKFNSDVVISNGFRFCPPLAPPEGGETDITEDYLWSMLPDGSMLKSGTVTGKQIRDWLERELENTFATDPARRFGGWLVRFKGLRVRFTIGKPGGRRLEEVTVRDEPMDESRKYTVLGCDREGDPDDTVCRIAGVKDPQQHDVTARQVVAEYLALHSPVSPTLEGRAVAIDAPAGLLSQVEGTTYRFR